MLDCKQLRTLIIQPALNDLQLYSIQAEELLVFTCANESNGGQYLKQVDGPALGIYQMEPNTYNDIWENFIKNEASVRLKMLYNFIAPIMPDEDRMIYDLRFATAMARIFYLRVSQPLPAAHSIDEIWAYYKTHYNTVLGAANYHDAISKYQAFTKS